jgi:hypothetical protein
MVNPGSRMKSGFQFGAMKGLAFTKYTRSILAGVIRRHPATSCSLIICILLLAALQLLRHLSPLPVHDFLHFLKVHIRDGNVHVEVKLVPSPSYEQLGHFGYNEFSEIAL